MTVATEISEVEYVGNGSTTQWDFAFPVHKKSDLKVYRKIIASGLEIELNSGAWDFTLTDSAAFTGYVTYPLSGSPLTNASKIILRREVPVTQELDAANQRALPPAAVETQLDRTTMQISDVKRVANLARSEVSALGIRVETLEFGLDPNTSTYAQWLANMRMVNPMEDRFGAYGDHTVGSLGSHDDTAAIQSAVDYLSSRGGGIVYINHHHKVTNSITHTNDEAKIIFYSPSEGIGSITYAGTADVPILDFSFGDYLGDASNPPWIFGLGFYRQSSVVGGIAVRCRYSDRIGDGRGVGFRVEDCVIDTESGSTGFFLFGVYAEVCLGARIVNNFIKGRGGLTTTKTGSGVYMGTWAQASKILDNRIQGWLRGIDVSDRFYEGASEDFQSEGVRIENNLVQNCDTACNLSSTDKEVAFIVRGNVFNGGRVGLRSRNIVTLTVTDNAFQWTSRNVDRCDIRIEGDTGTEGDYRTQSFAGLIDNNRSLSGGNLRLNVIGVTTGANTTVSYTPASFARTITGILTTGGIVRVQYSGSDVLEIDDEVYISGITVGPTELNNRTFTAGVVDTVANTVELEGVDPAELSAAWVSGGTIGLASDTGNIQNNHVIFISSMTGASEGNFRPYVVSDLNTGAGTFKLKDYYTGAYVDSSGAGENWSAWVNGGVIERYARHIEIRGGQRIKIGACFLAFRHVGIHLWPETKKIDISRQFSNESSGRPPSGGIRLINDSSYKNEILDEAAAGASYATRTELVFAVSRGLFGRDGDVVSAGGLFYRWKTDATGISDLPGMIPAGMIEVAHFGGLGADDDGPVIQKAIDYVESIKDEILFPSGVTLLQTTLRVRNAMTLRGRGCDIAAATNPNLANANSVLRWNSATSSPMLLIKATTSGNRVYEAEVRRILFDGNNVASHGVLAESPQACRFDLVTYRTQTRGLEINDNNSALANQNVIENFEHFCGPNAAAWNCTGLALDGNYTGLFATSTRVLSAECEYINGDGFMIRAHDSATVNCYKGYVRGGSGGTGYSIAFRKTTFGTPVFHCQKNIFQHVYATGKIFVGDYCKGNVIDILTSEGGSIVYESSGLLKRVLTINHLADFRTSEAWATRKFHLTDEQDIIVSSGKPIPLTAVPGDGTIGGTSIGYAASFSASATNGLTWSGVLKDSIYTGNITAVRLFLQTVGGVAGNGIWRVRFDLTAVGASVGALDRDQNFTIAMGSSPSVMSTYDCVFTVPVPVTGLNSIFSLAIERLGADAADTYPNVTMLVHAQLVYEGSGPSSSGYGPYEPPLRLDPANP